MKAGGLAHWVNCLVKNVKLWEYFIKQATATFCLNITLHVIDASNCNCNCSVLSQLTNRISLFLRNTSSILRCGSNIWLLWIYASINHHWYTCIIPIIKGRLTYITHYTVTMLWWIIWGDQPAIFSNFTLVTHCRVDVTMTHHIYLFFTVSTIVIVQIWGLLTFNHLCPIIFPCVRGWQPILWAWSIFQPACHSLSSWITVGILKG